MAAVVGDYGADHSRFHTSGPSMRHQDDPSSYHTSQSRPRDIPARHAPRSPESPSYRSPESRPKEQQPAAQVSVTADGSRLPSPPDSSSANTPSTRAAAHDADTITTVNSMSTQVQTANLAATTLDAAGSQTPTPPADDPVAQEVIVVRDLAHIASLARRPSALADTPLQAMKYEISSMPIGDIIEMVAALLTKITTTNDLQHDALHRNAAHQQTAANHNNDGVSMSPLSSSVLAFHGKNVPAITILSYLSRIHKYCPTTYEVFLSLLVYFDRMTERVNQMVLQAEEDRRQSQSRTRRSASRSAATPSDPEMPDRSNEDDDETDSDLADDESETKAASKADAGTQSSAPSAASSPLATYFVVDSFNIHRLIIAGVTCASKFFSDVFYTNSRYAKVGGLPLAELNHLELQFLVLNDFRLSVPVEDLEAYATMLVEFYAREIVGSQTADSAPEEE